MARDLSPTEIAELTAEQAAGITLPADSDEIREYTAAEVALLEDEGFEAEIDLEGATLDAAANEVTKALTLSRGNKHFKAVVIDTSANADRVNLYDTQTGYPYPVPRLLLRYYLDKVRADGSRVFSARRTVTPPARNVPCGAAVCREDGKRRYFTTTEVMEQHWAQKHRDDWQRRERAKERSDSERSIAILEGLARSLMEGKRELTIEELQAMNETAEKNAANLVPNESWSKARIIAWMETHGETYSISTHGRMTKGELLVAIGAAEPDEIAVAV